VSKHTEGYITALPPNVMEPRCVLREEKNSSRYHLSRHDNQTSRTREIQLRLPKASSVEPISILQDNEVKCFFLYDVFDLVRRVHIHPEQVENGLSKALLLKEIENAEKINMVESAKISIARQDFKRSYKRMALTHLNINFDGPKKRARVFDTYSTDLQQD
jgi:hypothetical protein